jgi:hypothetical protein
MLCRAAGATSTLSEDGWAVWATGDGAVRADCAAGPGQAWIPAAATTRAVAPSRSMVQDCLMACSPDQRSTLGQATTCVWLAFGDVHPSGFVPGGTYQRAMT